MYKLKQKNLSSQYSFLLKNKNLQFYKNTYKLKQKLFEKKFLFKIHFNNQIELSNCKSISLPSELIQKNQIYDIQRLFNENLLLNKKPHFDLIKRVHSIFLKEKQEKTFFKGRIINGKLKQVFVCFLGFIYPISFQDLNEYTYRRFCIHALVIKKKKLKKIQKQLIFSRRYTKNKQIVQRITDSYRLKYLKFKIEKKEKLLLVSRRSYLNELKLHLKKKNYLKKGYLFRKKYENK